MLAVHERDRAPFSALDLADYRDQNTVLDGLAPFINWTANLTGSGDAERREGVRIDLLVTLLAAVALLLFVAYANIANLPLASLSSRRREVRRFSRVIAWPASRPHRSGYCASWVTGHRKGN